MRWLWALVMVASASNSTCPGSPSATHAKCEVSLAFESACETVSTEILDRIRGRDGWVDPHNAGTYDVTSSTSSRIDGERVTADGHAYVDRFTFTFDPSAGDGGCAVSACSESQSPSVLDYSTNYCNLKDLYCNVADGCRIVHSDLAYDEVIEECSYTWHGVSSPQHDFSRCLVYVAPTPSPVATERASPTASPAASPTASPAASPVASPTARPAPLSTSSPAPLPTPFPRQSPSHSRAGVVGVAIAVILVLIAATYPLAGLILRLRRPLGTPSRALSQLRTRGFELAPIP